MQLTNTILQPRFFPFQSIHESPKITTTIIQYLPITFHQKFRNKRKRKKKEISRNTRPSATISAHVYLVKIDTQARPRERTRRRRMITRRDEYPPRRGSAIAWNLAGRCILASDSASRAANFTQNAKPYIETQTQWPRQVGRGAVLAARARVRETATPVHAWCGVRVYARRAERVGARVTALAHRRTTWTGTCISATCIT